MSAAKRREVLLAKYELSRIVYGTGVALAMVLGAVFVEKFL